MDIRELKSKNQDDPAGLTESSKFFYLNIGHAEFLETLKKMMNCKYILFLLQLLFYMNLFMLGEEQMI